jgi:hypothetical protein
LSERSSEPEPDPLEPRPEPDPSVVGTPPEPDSGTLGPVFDTTSVVVACRSDPESSISGTTVLDAEPRPREDPDESCESSVPAWSSTLVTVADTGTGAGSVSAIDVTGGSDDVVVVELVIGTTVVWAGS